MRKVTVERQQGEEMVIAQGLTAGEEVVTDGQLRLTPGAQVTTRHARRRAGGAGDGDGRRGGRAGTTRTDARRRAPRRERGNQP